MLGRCHNSRSRHQAITSTGACDHYDVKPDVFEDFAGSIIRICANCRYWAHHSYINHLQGVAHKENIE